MRRFSGPPPTDRLRPLGARWASSPRAVIVLAIPLELVLDASRRRAGRSRSEDSGPVFVGRDACADCHQAATEAWRGSDHDLAMAEATEETVLGDFDDVELEHRGVTSRFFRRDGGFFVHTEGPGGEMGEFEIAYTFGVEPLQQYLVPFPGGRLQALSLAWDTERGEWFHLYPDQDIPPDDWLHWTRNAQNWNGMCAECHSTNLIKGYDADDRRPSRPPGRRSTSAARPATGRARRTSRGPSCRRWRDPRLGDYGLVVPTGGISSRQQVELCAPCHSRRAELGRLRPQRASSSSTAWCRRCSTRGSTTPTVRSSTRSMSTAPSSRARCTATMSAAPTATTSTA